MPVTIRYWAAARAAAGAEQEQYDAGTLAELLAAATAAHGTRLGGVLGLASYLVDGERLSLRGPAGVPLADGAVVEVLPPFAGG